VREEVAAQTAIIAPVLEHLKMMPESTKAKAQAECPRVNHLAKNILAQKGGMLKTSLLLAILYFFEYADRARPIHYSLSMSLEILRSDLDDNATDPILGHSGPRGSSTPP
jgi:hypothetical protein